MDHTTAIGLAAAFFTTTSYLPQVAKVWRTRETDDISLKMLLALAAGLALWIAYGVMRSDAVIVIANSVSVAMVVFIIVYKLRSGRSSG